MSEVKMERVGELMKGRVAIIGEKSINRDIFCHVMREIGCSSPTVVLCRSKLEASALARDGDTLVPLGCSKGELLLDVFEPFLLDPSCASSVEGIAEEIVEAFFDYRSTTKNDPYWEATARTLFEEVMRYVFLMARQEKNFSFRNIAKLFQSIMKYLPETLDKRNPRSGLFDDDFKFEYPDELWVDIGEKLKEEPFKRSLIGIPATTASCILSSFIVAAKKLSKFLSYVNNRCGNENGENEKAKDYSLMRYLKDYRGDGAIFLYPDQKIRLHAPIFFESALRAVGVFSTGNKGQATLVIPNIENLKDVEYLCSLLGDEGSALSVIWGASGLNIIGSTETGEKNLSTVKRMIALSDGQAWSRLSDTNAAELYKGFIPESSRIYALPDIPKRLCFIRSDEGEFDSVTVPEATVTQTADAGQTKQEKVSFWRYSEPLDLLVNDDDDDDFDVCYRGGKR